MAIDKSNKNLNTEEETKLKIRALLEAEYEQIQDAADKIAPDFDYEEEAKLLEAEEAVEPVESEEVVVGADSAEMPPLPPAKVSHSKYLKPKYVPKTGLGRLVLKDRSRKVLVASIIMLAAALSYQAYDYFVPKPITILYTTYAGTEKLDYKTTSRTVGEVLDEIVDEKPFESQGIEIAKTDLFDKDDEVPIKKGTTINVMKSTATEAKIAGETTTLWLIPGTVEENLKLNDITYDDDDEIKPSLDTEISDDTQIVVNEIHYNIEEKKETVESTSRVILDPSLTSGVSETTEGNDGEGLYTYTTKYVNGKKQGTDKELKEWITEPHDTVLRLGTSSTGNSGEYIVSRTFTANSTAYTASSGARGALGEGVHVGTCAVDPSYVSLRSELWIAGYGYAYANDTGGAVKGNVVDVYMSSKSACIQWGRRNVTAYVLTPAN